MKKSILSALILSTCLSLQAQDVIILEDGGTMPMKQFEKMKDKPKCTGFFNQRTERMFYIKQRTNSQVDDLTWDKYSKDHAVEKMLEGEINMYIKTFGCGSTKEPAKCSTYFLEKGAEYRTVIETAGMTQEEKEENLSYLKSLIADDAEILKEVENEDFKLKASNIEEVVVRYNLRHFVKRPSATRTVSPVLFYLKNKLDGEPLVLQLNDSLKYELKNEVGVSIHLPANQVNKVCVSSGDLRHCDFVSSTPYFIKSYQVVYREGAKIEISRVPSWEAKRVLDYYRGK